MFGQKLIRFRGPKFIVTALIRSCIPTTANIIQTLFQTSKRLKKRRKPWVTNKYTGLDRNLVLPAVALVKWKTRTGLLVVSVVIELRSLQSKYTIRIMGMRGVCINIIKNTLFLMISLHFSTIIIPLIRPQNIPQNTILLNKYNKRTLTNTSL